MLVIPARVARSSEQKLRAGGPSQAHLNPAPAQRRRAGYLAQACESNFYSPCACDTVPPVNMSCSKLLAGSVGRKGHLIAFVWKQRKCVGRGTT